MATILKIVNKCHPVWWNLGVWRPDAWDFVEIGVVKFHYAVYLFAWGGCHVNARCVARAQSKFYVFSVPGRQNYGSRLALLSHTLWTAHWRYSSYWRLEAKVVSVVWIWTSQAPTPLPQNRFLGPLVLVVTANRTVNVLVLWGVEIKNKHNFDETWTTLCHCGTEIKSGRKQQILIQKKP